MVDYIAGGYLEDLTDRVDADKDIEQEDVGPFFRDFSQKYDGKIYMITLDGDFHMMYYRTDVLEAAGLKPPTTWDEYLAVAKAVNGKDMNGDGTPDYGSCIAKKRNAQSYWFVTDVAGSMTQSKGTSQGAFFNTADMKPLVDNEAFRKALDFLQGDDAIRPAERAQPRCRRHAAAVRLRPLRAHARLGRHRHARHRSGPVKVIDKGGAGDHAGLEGGARPRHAASSSPATPPPAPMRWTASTMRPSRLSAAGAAASTPRPTQGEGRGLRLLLLHGAAGRSPTRTSPSATPASTPTASRSSAIPTCGRRPG